jgi:Leucine-rich repeat (LRR) protein
VQLASVLQTPSTTFANLTALSLAFNHVSSAPQHCLAVARADVAFTTTAAAATTTPNNTNDVVVLLDISSLPNLTSLDLTSNHLVGALPLLSTAVCVAEERTRGFVHRLLLLHTFLFSLTLSLSLALWLSLALGLPLVLWLSLALWLSHTHTRIERLSYIIGAPCVAEAGSVCQQVVVLR